MGLRLVGKNVTSKMTKPEQKKHDTIVKSGKTKYTSSKSRSSSSRSSGKSERTKKNEPIRLGGAKPQDDVIRLGESSTKKDNSIKAQMERLKTGTTGSPILDNPIAKVMGSLETTAVLGSILGGLLLGGAGAGGGTAVAKAAKVGTRGISKTTNALLTRAKVGASSRTISIGKGGRGFSKAGTSSYRTNTKTIKQTESWLSKIFSNTKTVSSKNLNTGMTTVKEVTTKGGGIVPKLVAPGALIAAIGSYPFSGWLKQEALQTLSFGVAAAAKNNDIEGGERAMDEEEEILNPNAWDKILGAIPYVNTLKSLKDFYGAAKIKLSIDRQVFGQMKIQQESGETDGEKWARIDRERDEAREAQRVEDEKYYEDVRKRIADEKAQERQEEERYWEGVRKQNDERDAREREAEESYWADVRNQTQDDKPEAEIQIKDETAYWDDIRKKNAERKAVERAEESAYWDGVMKVKAERETKAQEQRQRDYIENEAERKREKDYWANVWEEKDIRDRERASRINTGDSVVGGVSEEREKKSRIKKTKFKRGAAPVRGEVGVVDHDREIRKRRKRGKIRNKIQDKGYWERMLSEREEREDREREGEERYWEAVRKRDDELRWNKGYSKLDFGLLKGGKGE